MVFFPRASVPLFISDKAGREMLDLCLEQNAPFGIALAEPVGKDFNNKVSYRPREICSIGLPLVISEEEDSCQVLLNGFARVQIKDIVQHLPFPVYEVEVLPDRGDATSEDEMTKLKTVLSNWLDINIPDTKERSAFDRALTTDEHIVDYLSMLLIKNAHTRQILLETNTLDETVHLLSVLFPTEDSIVSDSAIEQSIADFENLDKKVANSQ